MNKHKSWGVVSILSIWIALEILFLPVGQIILFQQLEEPISSVAL